MGNLVHWFGGLASENRMCGDAGADRLPQAARAVGSAAVNRLWRLHGFGNHPVRTAETSAGL